MTMRLRLRLSETANRAETEQHQDITKQIFNQVNLIFMFVLGKNGYPARPKGECRVSIWNDINIYFWANIQYLTGSLIRYQLSGRI